MHTSRRGRRAAAPPRAPAPSRRERQRDGRAEPPQDRAARERRHGLRSFSRSAVHVPRCASFAIRKFPSIVPSSSSLPSISTASARRHRRRRRPASTRRVELAFQLHLFPLAHVLRRQCDRARSACGRLASGPARRHTWSPCSPMFQVPVMSGAASAYRVRNRDGARSRCGRCAIALLGRAGTRHAGVNRA